MLEVQLDQNRVVTFDGRVLEVFGGAVRRFHVLLLRVGVSAADKHGNRTMVLTQSGVETAVSLDEAGFGRLRPILEALHAAGVTITGPGARWATQGKSFTKAHSWRTR